MSIVVGGSEALDLFNGDGFIDWAAAAGIFTQMIADVAENGRERDLLAHHSIGLGRFAFLNQSNVAGDVNPGRAGVTARYQVISFFQFRFDHADLVDDRPRRADLDAGAAEFTA